MDTEEFLAHVLPATGPYIIGHPRVDIDKKPYRHFLADDIDAAAIIAKHLDKRRESVYFAVGALKQARVLVDGRLKITRAATNIRGLRSYILDIDVREDGSGQFTTQRQALEALIAFVKAAQLPKPTVVDSGGGLHVYWTLDREVTVDEFKVHGEALKLLAKTHGLRIDGGRTADAASVLRVVGTHNRKYEHEPLVKVLVVGKPTPTEQFHARLSLRAATNDLISIHGPPPVNVADTFGSNTNRYEDVVLDLPLLVHNCQTFRYTVTPANQRLGAVAVPEPAWSAAMGLAVFCHKYEKAAHLISKDDPRYDPKYVDAKIVQFRKFGPTTCARFQEAYEGHAKAGICEGCPSKGLIGSPAAIAKYVPKAPPIMEARAQPDGTVVPVQIPDPPDPYVRTKNGMGMKWANPKTGANEVIIFCNYDMYPVKLRVDEKTQLEEDVMWRVKLPREDWMEVTIPHVTRQQLQTTLAKRSIYIDEHHLPHVANFMTAYTRKLQQDIPREVAFSSLGFRNKGSEFVLGRTLYKANGTAEEHSISRQLRNDMKDGVCVSGEYETWRREMSKYARPGLEAYRAYLYSSFGSILYHMTGHVATCLSASGDTGLGKSTIMEACASVWGDPAKIVVRGGDEGSTRAAVEVLSGAMHNLPVMLDEITGRQAKDVAALIFNYSGGKGKIRSTAQGGIRSDTATWSNLLLVNANTDEYERISSVFRESAQHLVRLVQLEFVATSAISKAEADILKRSVFEHYGHAGPVFVEFVVQNYIKVRNRVRDVNAQIDKRVQAKSEERFWTAWAACAIVAAEIAVQLDILPGFPVSNDADWIVRQIDHIRARVKGQLPVASELMAEFLDAHLDATLTIGAKGASNIDNVLHKPTRELSVRIEIDNHTAWINRAVFRHYCVEQGLNFNRSLLEMSRKNVITRDGVLKVLGADTQYAKGRVRCIQIDMDALGGKAALSLVQSTAFATSATATP